MTDYDAIDFFRGDELVADPYPYFDWLRAQCPVRREPHHDVVMVTGYDEAIAVYNDTATFSSCNSPTGPFPGFPVPLEGDDVSALIEQHRDELPMSDQLLTFDPPLHTAHRALLMRLITPKRLRENEEFMWRLADARSTSSSSRGDVRVHPRLRPAVRHARRRRPARRARSATTSCSAPGSAPGPRDDTGTVGSTGEALAHNPLEFLYEQFTAYIEDRRREPRDDVMTGMATATFPDGSIPEAIDVVAHRRQPLRRRSGDDRAAASAPRCSASASDPELQQRLRDHRELIPNFVEECLRIESPVKGDFRLARVTDRARRRRRSRPAPR